MRTFSPLPACWTENSKNSRPRRLRSRDANKTCPPPKPPQGPRSLFW
jgi:hypothetical protein